MKNIKQKLSILIGASLLSTAISSPVFASNVISPDQASAYSVEERADTAITASTEVPTIAHTDFGGKTGNLLIAVNPEPWKSTTGGVLPDTKNKDTGFLDNVDDESDNGLESLDETTENSLTREFASFHGRGFCSTFEMNKNIQGTPKKREGAALAETKSYQVGDVMVRIINKYSAGNESDYLEPVEGDLTSRIYQCVYVGEVSTIWGTVSEDNMTDKEKEIYKAVNANPVGSSLTDLERSEETERTNVSSEKAKELGTLFDKYIKKEKEYTGDYLKTDSLYGDNDGKACFFIEPMSKTGDTDFSLGYFWVDDLRDQLAGDYTMDGLHLNQIMLDNSTNDQLLTTMLHELQHCIAYGYSTGKIDAWIDEMFAQGVSMLVYGQDSEDVESFCKDLSSNNIKDDNLMMPYAFGKDTSCNKEACQNDYCMAYPLVQYLVEHADPNLIKNLTVEPELYTNVLSNHLSTATSHSLQGWMSCFAIALLSEVDGTMPKAEKGSDYYLGDSPVMGFVRQHYLGSISINAAIKPLSFLSDSSLLLGGGAARVFRATSDRSFDILDSSEGIVWALRNSNGEVVAVEGLDIVDKMPIIPITTDPVAVNMKIKGVGEVSANLSIQHNNLTYFKGKAKMTAYDLDLKVIVDFANSSDADKFDLNSIDISSAKYKNNKKVSVEGTGNYTVSAPSLKSVKIKALSDASKVDKALAKALNKEIKKILKKQKVNFDIYPLSISEAEPTITLDKNKDKIKKVTAVIGGKKYKLKTKEFEPILSNKIVIGIKGNGNFTGKFYPGDSSIIRK
ncbi:MAG: hypothetical protein K5989_03860 [Lachnospiraceae bacterium]|nr:hypothetical protein [Lachnospiraceae bacterium]